MRFKNVELRMIVYQLKTIDKGIDKYKHNEDDDKDECVDGRRAGYRGPGRRPPSPDFGLRALPASFANVTLAF